MCLGSLGDALGHVSWSDTGSGWLLLYFDSDSTRLDADNGESILIDGQRANTLPGFNRVVTETELVDQGREIWVTGVFFDSDRNYDGSQVQIIGSNERPRSIDNTWRVTDIRTAQRALDFETPDRAAGFVEYVRQQASGDQAVDILLWANDTRVGDSDYLRVELADQSPFTLARNDSEVMLLPVSGTPAMQVSRNGRVVAHEDSDFPATIFSVDFGQGVTRTPVTPTPPEITDFGACLLYTSPSPRD